MKPSLQIQNQTVARVSSKRVHAKNSKSQTQSKRTPRSLKKWAGFFWACFFMTWAGLLTGLGAPKAKSVSHSQGTGVVQILKLKNLKNQRQDEIKALESELLEVKAEILALKSSPVRQEREVRKVLGYVRKDELVFDFTKMSHRAHADAQTLAHQERKFFNFF